MTDTETIRADELVAGVLVLDPDDRELEVEAVTRVNLVGRGEAVLVDFGQEGTSTLGLDELVRVVAAA